MSRTIITIDEALRLERLARRLFGDFCDIRLVAGFKAKTIEPTINWPSMGSKSVAETQEWMQQMQDAILWVSALNCVGTEIDWSGYEGD